MDKKYLGIIAIVAVISLGIGLMMTARSAKSPDCSNVQKLDKTLRKAGIPIDGVNSDCVIWYSKNATAADVINANNILSTFNSNKTFEQLLDDKGYTVKEAALIVVLDSITKPKVVAAWATNNVSAMASDISSISIP